MAVPPSSDGIDWQMGSFFSSYKIDFLANFILFQVLHSSAPYILFSGKLHLLQGPTKTHTFLSFGINGKEPPLIGLYPLNTTNSTQSAGDVASFLSANSVTLATTLPNYILSTPTYTTPPFSLNTSISASIGAIVSSELANSTYSALFGQRTSLTNVSALPVITPPPNVVTLVITNPAGDVSTTISSRSMAAVTLGLPAGWNAGSALHLPSSMGLISTFVFVLPWLFLQTH